MTHCLALDFLSSADQECSRKLDVSLLIVLVHILFIRMHCINICEMATLV